MGTPDMSVGSRLRLGFGLVLALLVAVVALGVGHMAQMQQRTDQITQVGNLKTRLAQQAAQLARLVRAFKLEEDPGHPATPQLHPTLTYQEEADHA